MGILGFAVTFMLYYNILLPEKLTENDFATFEEISMQLHNGSSEILSTLDDNILISIKGSEIVIQKADGRGSLTSTIESGEIVFNIDDGNSTIIFESIAIAIFSTTIYTGITIINMTRMKTTTYKPSRKEKKLRKLDASNS